MRSTAHIQGHPIHPMLVGFPAAYLLGSACADVWAHATERDGWFRTARNLNTLGIGSALVAAVPGLVDYLTAVPPRSSAKSRATTHMLANVSALSLFALARLGRRAEDDRPRSWALAAEMCGAGLVAVAGWMGGTLVYRNQIGVDHRYANAGKWSAISASPAEPDYAEVAGDIVDELGVDQMRLIHAGEARIVLGRTEAGVAAFSDRCTHKGGPLSDGVLACGVVQCPWHGSQFDVATGDVKQGPAHDPIETFAVERVSDRARISRTSSPDNNI